MWKISFGGEKDGEIIQRSAIEIQGWHEVC